LLLKRGASVSSLDRHKEPIIHYAATAGNTAICQMLLDYGADLYTNCSGGTVMHHAARAGHDSVVQLLLDSGVHVDATERFEPTPFLCAALCQRISTALLLLDSGADIEARHKSADGGTALHIFAASGNSSMISLLLALGANIEARDSRGRTPLLCAAGPGGTGRIQAIHLLLDHGANTNAVDVNGSRALHHVAALSTFRESEVTLTIPGSRDKLNCHR